MTGGTSSPVQAVVIGASAGGIEGLSTLLPALAPTVGASVLVALHVPARGAGALSDVLQAHCALPVREAEDKEPLRPGVVYLAPPDYHLLVEAGPRVALSVDPPVHFCRPSIDVLFESAAEEYGPGLLGIILTGANADGADGLAAVAGAGGRTVVQDPETALAPTMPRAALEACTTAAVLPLPGIADVLRSLGEA